MPEPVIYVFLVVSRHFHEIQTKENPEFFFLEIHYFNPTDFFNSKDFYNLSCAICSCELV